MTSFFWRRAPRASASNPGQTPWRVWYNADEVGRGRCLALLTDFVAASHPTLSRTLYAGSSGGSIYLTGNYFAYVANVHPRVMVANCGCRGNFRSCRRRRGTRAMRRCALSFSSTSTTARRTSWRREN